MENELAEINPKKAELLKLASKFGKLAIKGIDDTEGYKAVQSARKELQVARSAVVDQGKKLRAEAVATQKAIIVLVDDLVGIITPEEDRLKKIKDAIDHEKETERRKKSLPERKAKLEAIDVTLTDEMLLEMTDMKFIEFFNEQKTLYLDAKEAEAERQEEIKKAELEAEKKKVEAEKLKIQAEKDKIEQDKIDLAEAERLKTENAKAEKVRLAKEEKEKKEAVEKAKIEERERIEKEAEKKEAEEAEAKEKRERLAKYQDFLKKKGWTEETKDDFLEKTEGNVTTLYKKIGRITLE